MADSEAGPGALRHRDDLQGLRAVAVLLVVLGHAGVRAFQGGYIGVDVFFVLSGYLITGLLLTEAAKTGRISLAEFYRRRARRILPAAVLTLIVTDLAAWQLLNLVRAKQAVLDSLWASAFAANIHFAAENSDYFARNRPVSPLQHFWTLSVEEQFYLVWPVVLALVLFGILALRFRPSAGGIPKAGLYRAFVFIFVAGEVSLAWSIHATNATPASAYFSTFARAWELALGAALAIAAPKLKALPPFLQTLLSAAGLACIGAAAVLFSASTSFPGYAALLPTIGAALVIGAGIPTTRPNLSVLRVLSLAPFRYVGDRSYAMYLWHWPVLILAAQYEGHDLSLRENLLLVGGAFVLSIVSYATFEDPIRHMRFRRPAWGLLLWPASLAAVLLFALPILHSINSQAARIASRSATVRVPPLRDPGSAGSSEENPLPAVLAAARAAEHGDPIPWPLVPAITKIETDGYALRSGCDAGTTDTSSRVCPLGDLSSTRTLAVFGDSHARMWLPTILRMAERDHWRVLPIVKEGCAPKLWVGPSLQHCNVWFRWAAGRVSALRPTVSLIIGKWSQANPAAAARGVMAAVTAFSHASAHVVVVSDPVVAPGNSVDCLLTRGATMKTCSPIAPTNTIDADRAVAQVVRQAGAGFMGVGGWFCAHPEPGYPIVCPLVVNRTITLRDFNHVSETYALELSNEFRSLFKKALAGS